MPSDLDPVLSQESKEEDYDTPITLSLPVEKWKQLKKFRKTRDAVLGGVPLFDFSKSQLDSEGYMQAWPFNAAQSALAGGPGSILVLCKHLLLGDTGTNHISDRITELLVPLAIPYMLTVAAYVIGRSSLWKRDSTKAGRKRAARIFLYLDAAYGFFPQLLISTAQAVQSVFGIVLPTNIVGYATLYQAYVSLKTIPESLFDSLGYRGSKEHFTQLNVIESDERSNPPKWKLRVALLIMIPAIVLTGIYLIVSFGDAVQALVIRLKT